MSIPVPGPHSTAVVTGASSGIGAEIARILAKAGHHVTLVARTTAKLEELAADIGDSTVITCDLGDRSARADLADQLERGDRAVDVLINNAGFGTTGPVSRADVHDELHMIDVNVAAVTDLATRFIPGMVRRGRGAVLNVASTAAFQPLPGQACYAATKAFVLSYSQALAAEVGGSGVTVTALCPGPVQTGFGVRSGLTDQEAAAALPKILWVEAGQVARQAVAALEAGRPVVVPGAANRATGFLARHTPRRVLLPILVKEHPKLP
jgi:short-subunit dehydrogenase